MASRLRMTGADYLAIAVSPALIMCLVGSLVFFLIEVLYVGDYQARITYVFAWLVFATVLIGRISIEMGSERAALYSIPLALAVFVVLQAFVEYSIPFGPLINITLIAIVWWCSHRLTWDCTLIDDSQDASGEGLLQQIGVDDEEGTPLPTPQRNELERQEQTTNKWQRWITGEGGPHTPGLWVLYFSLAALPLFGVGQAFIPASDTAGRRYAFVLLAIYVASGLSLLVTTSFLGLRRYLRQRQVEMPLAMATRWVGIGAGLIAVVMLVAMLLPRPRAEYAISQAPWQMTSPSDLEPSRYGVGPDGVETEEAERTRASDDPEAQVVDSTEGKAPGGEAEGKAPSQGEGEGSSQGEGESQSGEESQGTEPGDNESPSSESGEGDRAGEGPQGERPSDSGRDQGEESPEGKPQAGQGEPNEEGEGDTDDPEAPTEPGQQGMLDHSQPQQTPQQVLQQASRWVGGLYGLVKWIFYLGLAALLLYLGWKYRHELLAALRDIIRDLRAWLARLWGGSQTISVAADEPVTVPKAPRRSFRQFRNPFEQEGTARMNPAQLVVYTFEALEAWGADRGDPRGPEQTPQEYVRRVVDSGDPNYEAARQMASLYNRLAYGGGGITPREAEELEMVWNYMLSAPPAIPRAG